MTFNLTIDMDNAAFDDGAKGFGELGRILATIGLRMQQDGEYTGKGIYDGNGNFVGQWNTQEPA